MQVNSKNYQGHPVFEKIEKHVEFYNLFSDSVMRYMTPGTRALGNIDTYVYTSMSGTLDSIRLILKNGYINDAFALLRKFHDSAIMNIYTMLFIEDNLDVENFIVQKIQNWLSGTEKLPDYRGMDNYIRDSKHVRPVYELLKSDTRYKEIRERCTNNMHYNFYWNVMLNDNQIYMKERGSHLDQFSDDLDQLIIMHLSYIFYFQNRYLSSSDYVDYLDCNMTPPEDSQYWVAPYIQETFNNLIKKHRPDLASLIKEHTAMHIE